MSATERVRYNVQQWSAVEIALSSSADSRLQVGLKDRYRTIRDRWRAHLPVTRKEYRRHAERVAGEFARLHDQFVELQRSVARTHEQLAHLGELLRYLQQRSRTTEYLLALPRPAATANFVVRVPLAFGAASELALVVTHASRPTLKAHVIDHIAALRVEGIAVVLVVNTSLAQDAISIDAALAAELSGCLIRENVGFDFGAWAHAWALAGIRQNCDRLFLINDSIVGPLRVADFAAMIARIRNSSADFIGLTRNAEPEPHLQSYFLVINRRLLQSPIFARFMQGVVNMTTKYDVISQYEVPLSRFFESAGFMLEALFGGPEVEASRSNHTIHAWRHLVAHGFPFLKSEVLAQLRHTDELASLIPDRYRQAD